MTRGVRDNFYVSSYSHSDPFNSAIRKYENCPSMINIKRTIVIAITFHFSCVDKIDLQKSVGNLNSSKVGTFKNIPAKCLKVTSGICSLFLAIIWNEELILNENNYHKS